MKSEFTDYLSWSDFMLQHRLCEIAEELASVYSEIGLSKAGEYEARREMWMNPRESSVSARDADARYASATYTISLIELEAQERSLVEEKFLIIRLLDMRCLTSRTPISSTG